jgi:hypothetical protein
MKDGIVNRKWDPHKGGRLGPAWQEFWDLLADGEWHPRSQMEKELAQKHDLMPRSMKVLIWQAEQQGWIERKIEKAKGKPYSVAWVRRRGEV